MSAVSAVDTLLRIFSPGSGMDWFIFRATILSLATDGIRTEFEERPDSKIIGNVEEDNEVVAITSDSPVVGNGRS